MSRQLKNTARHSCWHARWGSLQLGGSGGLLSAFFPCFFPAGDKEAALRDTLYQRRMHPQRPVCVSVVHRRDFQNDEGVRQAAKYSKVL